MEDAISKEEVFFTGRRNIEALASIVSVLLPRLVSSSLNPAIVNVDDNIEFDEQALKPGQIFFLSSLQFKDAFTHLIGKALKDVATISIKVNF